jgi:zinc transport system substrate-binding protein
MQYICIGQNRFQVAGFCFPNRCKGLQKGFQMRLYIYFIVLISGLWVFSGPASGDGRIPVYVSILPQADFVQQIAKDRVDVQVMVVPGASPATYEPKPRQMAGLARARAYFAIGAPFEKVWLSRIAAANPAMRIVQTDAGIAKRPMAAHYHAEALDSHEDAGRGSPDPHIWLSPPLVKIQAGAIRDALTQLDPARRDFYEVNYSNFVARLDDLDGRLRATFAGRQGLRFMVFHPAWGYFADAYGLVQVPIELEGKDPKPARLAQLIQIARRHEIRVIFVQPQFSSRSAEMVAREIGGRVVPADPLPSDWIAGLSAVADRFDEALR